MKNAFANLDQFMSSATRCHVVGAILSLALVFATAWIWSNADAFATDDQYAPEQIEAANRLVAEADTIRSKFADGMLLSKQNKRRIKAIREWLPTRATRGTTQQQQGELQQNKSQLQTETSWQETSKRIREIAQSANVQLTSLDKGKHHAGDRIGVQEVVCELQGSYADICRSLNGLANNRKPIWCDSISVRRTPAETNDGVECRASISLRVPFAASGTIAAKLLASEVPDAG